MTAIDPPEGGQLGGDVLLPADLRVPIRGERDPESLRANLRAVLVEHLRDDPLPLVVLFVLVVGGLGGLALFLALAT